MIGASHETTLRRTLAQDLRERIGGQFADLCDVEFMSVRGARTLQHLIAVSSATPATCVNEYNTLQLPNKRGIVESVSKFEFNLVSNLQRRILVGECKSTLNLEHFSHALLQCLRYLILRYVVDNVFGSYAVAYVSGPFEFLQEDITCELVPPANTKPHANVDVLFGGPLLPVPGLQVAARGGAAAIDPNNRFDALMDDVCQPLAGAGVRVTWPNVAAVPYTTRAAGMHLAILTQNIVTLPGAVGAVSWANVPVGDAYRTPLQLVLLLGLCRELVIGGALLSSNSE